MNIKYFLVCAIMIFSRNVSAEVITCGDAYKVGGEAKYVLHREAQKRAQVAIEEMFEKKIKKPFVNTFQLETTPEKMAVFIETFWCESNKTPLHSAYYRFYSSNKHVFKE